VVAGAVIQTVIIIHVILKDRIVLSVSVRFTRVRIPVPEAVGWKVLVEGRYGAVLIVT
jgi:hypothetical protein